jgi:hypothetical protein
MGQPPTEPSADLRQFANLLWQMFTALCTEGFTEKQALRIVGETISANFKPQEPE